jgi:hypothetical protein
MRYGVKGYRFRLPKDRAAVKQWWRQREQGKRET